MKNIGDELREVLEDFKRRFLVAGGDIHAMGLPIVTLGVDDKGNLTITEDKNSNTNGAMN